VAVPVFREATSADVDASSELLVELYAHELPDMLHGSHHAQAALTRRLLVAAPLGLRWVLDDGSVIATGGIATAEEPRPRTPASAVLSAPLHMDPVRAALTVAGAVRGVLTIAGPPAGDEVLLHSVVVAATQRGSGLGRLLVEHLEDQGRRRGPRHPAGHQRQHDRQDLLPIARVRRTRPPARPPLRLPVGDDEQATVGALEGEVEVLPPGVARVFRRLPAAEDPVVDVGDEALVEVRVLTGLRPVPAAEGHGELAADAAVVLVERHELIVGVAASEVVAHSPTSPPGLAISMLRNASSDR